MKTYQLDSTGWALNILDFGEPSPLESHAFELAADDEGKAFYLGAAMTRTYGLDSVKAACIAYARSAKRQ